MEYKIISENYSRIKILSEKINSKIRFFRNPGGIINLSAAAFVCLMMLVSSSVLAPQKVFSQEYENGDVPAKTVIPSINNGNGDTAETEKKAAAGNSNIDATVTYGQYNNIFSSFSIAQNFDNFTYQLNSNFKRSNDFGYANSSFYESELGFTGNYDMTEDWKISPQIQVNNESHGMFENTQYSREEKDKFIFRLQNEYNQDPATWRFNVNGAQYVHRLVSANSGDVRAGSFYKLSEEAAWENIKSASNTYKIEHSYTHYFYSADNADDDYYTSNRATADVKIMEYAKLNAAAVCDWNRDSGVFVSGRGGLSSSGLKNFVYEAGYEYLLKPFKPEDFYFEQKFIRPTYGLPPEKIHRADLKFGYDWKTPSKEESRFLKFKLKTSFVFELSDNYYNYAPASAAENLIDAEPVKTGIYRGRIDTAFDWKLMKGDTSLGLFYEYAYYDADTNITYRPSHKTGVSAKIRNKGYEAEWINTYTSSFYIMPGSPQKLDGFIYGSLIAQKLIYESFYLYARADNLYNSDYSYRFNYPEPGFTVSAGLRIKY